MNTEVDTVLGKKMSISICVLGPHRSGTSVVARSLNIVGAYIGETEDLMCPAPDNPEGFWERVDICHQHDLLLSSFNREWSSVNPMPNGWEFSDKSYQFKKEISSIIMRVFVDRDVWLWKDPRTCLVLPLWIELLSSMNIELKSVFVVRNPLDVAKSLQKRNGFSIEKGVGIWLNYSVSALRSLIGRQVVFVQYEDFVRNPVNELGDILEFLAIDQNLMKLNLFNSDVCVNRGLHHNVSSSEELIKSDIDKNVLMLYQQLRTARYCIEENLERIVLECYQQMTAYQKMYEDEMSELFRYKTNLEEIVRSPENLPVLNLMRKTLDEREKMIKSLLSEISDLKKNIRDIERLEKLLHFDKLKKLFMIYKNIKRKLKSRKYRASCKSHNPR